MLIKTGHIALFFLNRDLKGLIEEPGQTAHPEC